MEELIQEIFCKSLSKIRTYDPTRYRFLRLAVPRRPERHDRFHSPPDQLRERRAGEGTAHAAGASIQRGDLEVEWDRIHRQKILKHPVARAVRAEVKSHVWNCFVGRLQEDRPAQDIARELGMKDTNAVYVNATEC